MSRNSPFIPGDDVEPLALRPRQAAKALGICERVLWQLTQNGQIPCVRLGSRLVVYPIDTLRTWLTSQATPLDTPSSIPTSIPTSKSMKNTTGDKPAGN